MFPWTKLFSVKRLLAQKDEDVLDSPGGSSGGLNSGQEEDFDVDDSVTDIEKARTAALNLLEDLNTEKARVEETVLLRTKELKEEKARLKAAIESFPSAFFLVDSNFKIVDRNSKLKDFFPGRETISLDDLQDKFKGFADVKGSCSKVLGNHMPISLNEFYIDNKFIKFLFVPVEPGEGEDFGVLGLLNDVTEQKVLERSKDEFFSIASHELRTPLAAIRGNASMLLDFFVADLPNKEVKQMIQDIKEGGERLIKVVNDFLDVSSFELGKVIFTKEELDIVDIVREMARVYETLAAKKGLFFNVKVEEKEPLYIFADKARTKQIIVNLISNAVKNTEKGGIEIIIDGSAFTQKGFRSVIVKDTGIGISEEARPLLFRKFQQAQEKLLTRDMTQGTGLGLYLSKRLAEAMGGDVVLLESEPGKGSSFMVSLPIK